ncbi:MAG: endonuclease III [Clostridia bacterium]|nr:endonuclease III [Clostridia bacterium]
MRSKLKVNAQKVWEILENNFGDAQCSLIKDTPYRLAIRGILSAQCTDKRVNEETGKLFRDFPDPSDIYKLDYEVLSKYIAPCGLTKAKTEAVIEFTRRFIEDWNCEIPRDTDELMKCKGVGRKIANLMVGEIYGIQRTVVDTHLKRVAYRIGLTDETNPIKVEMDLDKIFEENQRINLGHRMIELGRSFCQARKPDCDSCPMNEICKKRI